MHTFANPQQVVLSWYRMARHLKELLFCLFFSSQSFSHAPTESVVPGRHSVCTVCMFSVCVFSVFTGVKQYAWCWFTNMKVRHRTRTQYTHGTGITKYDDEARHGTRKGTLGGGPTVPPHPAHSLFSFLFFSPLLSSSLLTSVKVPRSRFTSLAALRTREEFHALVPTALHPRAVRAVRLGGCARVSCREKVEGLKG